MKRLILYALFFLTMQPHATAQAYTTVPLTIAALVENARKFDGEHMSIRGEAIGRPMGRGSHLWLNICDSNNSAMGVWIEKPAVKEIRHLGSYQEKGDTVAVEGIFHRACPEHGGETDIHATKIRIVEKGKRRFHPISTTRISLAIILLGSAGFLFLKYDHMRKRSPIAS